MFNYIYIFVDFSDNLKRRLMINYSDYEISYSSYAFKDFFGLQSPLEFSPLEFGVQSDQINSVSYRAGQALSVDIDSYCDNVNTLLFEQSEIHAPLISTSEQCNQALQSHEHSLSHMNLHLSGKNLKVQTKNIPKNFGKGIITFIEKNERKMRKLFKEEKLAFNTFKVMLKSQKKTINTIADLRRLWTDIKYGKCMRIISNLFFRRYAMGYIFNSKIVNYSSHIKYRKSLWQALKNPDGFNHIKEF